MKILVIDDDANLRKLISVFMIQRGWEVAEAANGRIGVERARSVLPDVILCDFEMDEMNGHQALAALRQDPATATIPFILMTGAPERAGLRSTMDMGADDYLPKPFAMEQLMHAVQARLDRVKSTRSQAEQELGALRRQISLALPHELKTPLNGILGLTELLRSGYDSFSRSDVISMLDDINKSGVRLERLIRNYLSYLELLFLNSNPTKAADFGGGSSEQSATLISDMAKNVVARHNRDGCLVLELAEAVPAIAPENLVRLVEELVDNACKFSPAGSTVRVESSGPGRVFLLRVRDRGRGISPEHIREIGAYMQFDRQRYEQQGAGLGLAICRLLVELHGGSIGIESLPNMGTTVNVRLPLAGGRNPG